MLKGSVAVVLAGGKGKRLSPLTLHESKPAVSFGGIYRIIDFTLTNCLHSGIRRIFVLTQYKSYTLHRHLRSGWQIFHHELGEFIDIIPPQMNIESFWYRGTADAVYQNIKIVNDEDPEYLLVLSGDHIYKMDYRKIVSFHRDRGANLTIASFEVPVSEASRFGIIQVNDDWKIVGFQEKPENPEAIPGKPYSSLVSMGIYVFDFPVLREALEEDAKDKNSQHDFGKNVIPKLLKKGFNLYAFPFRNEKGEPGYWRDIGTLDAYYEASMELVSISPRFNLYDSKWPIRTYMPQYPPAKFAFNDPNIRKGEAVDSIIGAGAIISGSRIINSIISYGVRVHSYNLIENSIIHPNVVINRYSKIKNAIISEGTKIPKGTIIGYNLKKDIKRGFTVTPKGITVVTSENFKEETL